MPRTPKTKVVQGYPSWLPQRILFVARTGPPWARRVAGAYAPPLERLLGVQQPEPASYTVDGGEHGRTDFWDVRHLIGQAGSGSHDALELLFSEKGDQIFSHAAFSPALNYRDSLLSKEVVRWAMDDDVSVGPTDDWASKVLAHHAAAQSLLSGLGFPGRRPDAAVVADLASKSRSAQVKFVGALRRRTGALLKKSNLRDRPDLALLDRLCTAVVGLTLGHRIQVPVQGEWKSDTWSFSSGQLYTRDLAVA